MHGLTRRAVVYRTAKARVPNKNDASEKHLRVSTQSARKRWIRICRSIGALQVTIAKPLQLLVIETIRCQPDAVHSHNEIAITERTALFSDVTPITLLSTKLLIPLSHLCGSSRVSLRFCGKYFCRRKAAVASRKVADGLHIECGQYGSFTVFAIFVRFPAVVEPRGENRGLNRISVKGYKNPGIHCIHIFLKTVGKLCIKRSFS